MLTPDQISEIHRLHLVEKWSLRKIARHLHIGRHTMAKYLATPRRRRRASRERTSKLDPYKAAIAELLSRTQPPTRPSSRNDCRPLGYDGGITILKDYLAPCGKTLPHAVLTFAWSQPPASVSTSTGATSARCCTTARRASFTRFAWSNATAEKCIWSSLTAKTFETFVRCHIHAFEAFPACARELWFDNLATAVAEHEGNLVRFNPRFLAFAREYGFIPRACHVAAAWEKGKVERAIGYVRQNFWPLRSFPDLADVNAQARKWLDEIANQRQHRETGQAPDANVFSRSLLRPLPPCFPITAIRPRRSFIKISGSPSMATATACPLDMWATSSPSRRTLPPSPSTISIKEIVCYARCWQRGQTFGAERFQKELYAQMAAGATLGDAAAIDRAARTRRRKNICEGSPIRTAPCRARCANCSL